MYALEVLVGVLKHQIEHNGSEPLTTADLLELLEVAVDAAHAAENDEAYAWMEE